MGALNDIYTDTRHHDTLVRKGLPDIETYLDTLSSGTSRKLDIFQAKYMIEKHITQVNNALMTLQRNIHLVPERVGTAVAQLVEALRYKSEGGGSIPDGVIGIFH